jgi:hypothetical protein
MRLGLPPKGRTRTEAAGYKVRRRIAAMKIDKVAEILTSLHIVSRSS